ncbi:MAG: type III-B CRISPR module RAMP protein Cmr4, partial [Pseudonocardiaceae bacterium]
MPSALLFLYAESPVHAGADSSLGVLDLPIQREASTGLPVIWGQSLKGALRSHFRPLWLAPKLVEVFGAEPPAAGSSAGGSLPPGTLSVGDAQLTAMPVPTLVDTYAWVTSALVLGRLERKAGLVGLSTPARSVSRTDEGSGLTAGTQWAKPATVLGPYVVDGRHDDAVTEWAQWLSSTALSPTAVPQFFRTKLTTDLLAVADSILVGVTTECAELTPRIQLESAAKTVKHGPFYSEYLPTETILTA